MLRGKYYLVRKCLSVIKMNIIFPVITYYFLNGQVTMSNRIKVFFLNTILSPYTLINGTG